MVRKAKLPVPPSADHGPPDTEVWKDRRPYFNIYTPEANAYQIDHNFPKKYKIYVDRNKHWFCFYNYYRYSCPFYNDKYRKERNEKPFAYHALAKQHVFDWLQSHPNDAMAIEHIRKMEQFEHDGVIVTENDAGGRPQVIEYKPKPIQLILSEPAHDETRSDDIDIVFSRGDSKELIISENKSGNMSRGSISTGISDNVKIIDNHIFTDDNGFIKMLKDQLDASKKQLEKMTLERKEVTDTLMNLIKKLIG